jgi:hypothetical protein
MARIVFDVVLGQADRDGKSSHHHQLRAEGNSPGRRENALGVPAPHDHVTAPQPGRKDGVDQCGILRARTQAAAELDWAAIRCNSHASIIAYVSTLLSGDSPAIGA